MSDGPFRIPTRFLLEIADSIRQAEREGMEAKTWAFESRGGNSLVVKRTVTGVAAWTAALDVLDFEYNPGD